MKKIIVFIIFVVFFTNENNAQSEIEALRYSQKYIGGSARFVGMSGAFGALGGDLGAVTINPASAGLFRASQFVVTPQMSFDESTTNYLNGNERGKEQNSAFSIGNLGYVGTFLTGESTGLTSLSFALSFNRVADFNQYYSITGVNQETSMIDAIIGYANGTEPDYLWSYIDRLAYDTYLISYDQNTGNYYTGLDLISNQTQTKEKQTYGGMNEFDISLGASFSNKLYIGGSIGITSVNYREYSTYSELNNKIDTNFYDVKYFALTETLLTDGFGMNIKVGAIYRPVNWFRVGLALHSGTFLALNEEYDTEIESEVQHEDIEGNLIPGYESFNYAPADADGFEIGSLISNYYIKTPGKTILSFAFIINKMAIISLDYERINYSKISIDAFDYNLDDINLLIKDQYRAVNNLRIGLEVRNGMFSMRGGAAYYDSPYKNEDFFLDPSQLSFSAGAGINKGDIYFDLAYTLTNFNRTDYFYVTSDNYNLVGTDISSKKANVIASIGFRF